MPDPHGPGSLAGHRVESRPGKIPIATIKFYLREGLLPDGALDLYGRHMHDIAQLEIDHMPIDSPAAAIRYVVLGTVLIEPVLLALRRMAQQEIPGRRFG